MKKTLLIIFVIIILAGCSEKPEPVDPKMFQSSEVYQPHGKFLFFSDSKFKSSVKKGSNVKFDEHGIPQILISKKYVYNIVTIAQYGLQEYGYYVVDNDKSHLDTVRETADWLVNHQDHKNGKWYYTYDYAVGMMDYTMKDPWISAMAQGQAISLLVRANHVFPNQKYLDAAEKALEPLKIDVNDGGLVRNLFGHPHYEEFPTDPGSFALNGFMFTLLGLYDLSMENPESDARYLYQQGIETLEATLPLYDQHDISAYHLGHISKPERKIHTNAEYHQVHIIQLEALADMTKSSLIKYYHDLWKSYLKPLK